MDRVFLVIDWIVYVFGRGRRKAWCELTGGHDDQVLGSWCGDRRANAIKLHCFRCSRETGWIRVPNRDAGATETTPLDIGDHP